MFSGGEFCRKKIKVDKQLLHRATANNNLVEMERLLENGHDAYVNDQDDFMYTPLHYACNEEAAKLLIAKGADVNAKDGMGHTPLSAAYLKDNICVAKVLLRNGANFFETKQICRLPLDLTEKQFFDIMFFGDWKSSYVIDSFS